MSIVPPDLRQYLFRRKMSCPPRNPRRFLTAVKSRSVCFRCLYFPYRCFRCPCFPYRCFRCPYFPYRCFRCLCFPYCYFPPDRQIHDPRCQYSAGRQWLSGFPGRCPQSSGKSPPPCHNHHSAGKNVPEDSTSHNPFRQSPWPESEPKWPPHNFPDRTPAHPEISASAAWWTGYWNKYHRKFPWRLRPEDPR